MQHYADVLIGTLQDDLSVYVDIDDYPEVKVFNKPLTGEDEGCDGIYDPETNEIHLVYDPQKVDYDEYGDYCNSGLIGDKRCGNAKERLRLLLLHELAHWMTDFILKDYTHKHGRQFKLCYALLRSKY